MGWAARRKGSYEHRKANAIMRDRKAIEAMKVKQAKRLAVKPPEERVESRKALALITMASIWNTNNRRQ